MALIGSTGTTMSNLTLHRGGIKYRFSYAKDEKTAARNREIVRRFHNGERICDLANLLGLTPSRVSAIKKETETGLQGISQWEGIQ